MAGYVWVVTKHEILDSPVFHWDVEFRDEGIVEGVYANHGDAAFYVYKKDTGADYRFVISRRKVK